MLDEISSTEFRKVYASLKRPVLVTVNGHPVGQWVPTTVIAALPREVAHLNAGWDQAIHQAIRGDGPLADEATRPLTQAERDAILRRINKGG